MVKKCNECKKEVSCEQWAYKDDLCKRCYQRKRYRESNPQCLERVSLTKESSKEDLIKIIQQRDRTIGILSSNIALKNSQVRCFRLRMRKMRNSLDYLLKHPFSLDTSYKGKKHKRDNKFRRNEK